MSKYKAVFVLLAGILVLILQLINNSAAQDLIIKVQLEPQSRTVTVTCDMGNRRASEIRFLNSYGSITDLGHRISDVVDVRSGKPFKLLDTGRYQADPPVSSFRYRLDLTQEPSSFAAAHVSWFSGGRALLFADDIFPQFSSSTGKINVSFQVPAGWSAQSSELMIGNRFVVSELEKAVFYLGSDVRTKAFRTGTADIRVSLAGTWLFSDEESLDMSRSIFNEYRKSFGEPSGTVFQINISKFPTDRASGAWEADTRGTTISVISSDMPFKSQSLQRLHEQLRHEIFHLWLPGNLRLTGNYDWFYEGFAMYRSLRAGVELNQIRFEDMLTTLSRAAAIDRTRDRSLSLIESAKSRWAGGNDQVYARGILVGFLSDIAMISASGGKRDSAELVRDIIRTYSDKEEDGNEVVLRIMRARRELILITDAYVSGKQDIDWTAHLADTGIQFRSGNMLSVVPSPTGKQKTLLDKLGYNSWRKLSSKK
jgi:hypothetical protein